MQGPWVSASYFMTPLVWDMSEAHLTHPHQQAFLHHMGKTMSQTPLAAQCSSVFPDKSCYVFNTSSPPCCACWEANRCRLMRMVINSQVKAFPCLQVVPLCWLGSEVKQEFHRAWKTLWLCMCVHACKKIRCTLMHPRSFIRGVEKNSIRVGVEWCQDPKCFIAPLQRRRVELSLQRRRHSTWVKNHFVELTF